MKRVITALPVVLIFTNLLIVGVAYNGCRSRDPAGVFDGVLRLGLYELLSDP